MAVTISPGWGNMSWASGRLDEDKNVRGFSKFASRRRFDWDTPAVVQDQRITTYDPSSAYSPDSFFSGTDEDSIARNSYSSAATQRVADSFYGSLGDYGKNVAFNSASMYGMAQALGAKNIGFGDVLGAAARPSIGSALSLPSKVVSSAFGLDEDTGWTGKVYDAATTALGFALKSNPITAVLRVAAPLAKNVLGDITNTRPREAIRDYARDKIGWGRAQGAYADATAGINAGLNRANHMQDTFTDAVESGRWAEMSPEEQNLMSSFVNYEASIPYSDVLAGRIQASTIAALDNARLHPDDVPALADAYFGTALDSADSAIGWSGNKDSINNPNTPAAKALAAQKSNFSPDDLADVNASAIGAGYGGDIGRYAREAAVQGAINRALARSGYGGLGGNFDSGGNRTGSITGSGGIGAALGRVNDALGDNAAPGGGGDPDSGPDNGGYGGEHGGNGLGGEGEGGSPAGGI